jgi:hypothetical protein
MISARQENCNIKFAGCTVTAPPVNFQKLNAQVRTLDRGTHHVETELPAEIPSWWHIGLVTPGEVGLSGGSSLRTGSHLNAYLSRY